MIRRIAGTVGVLYFAVASLGADEPLTKIACGIAMIVWWAICRPSAAGNREETEG